jgi:hypothetical protein
MELTRVILGVLQTEPRGEEELEDAGDQHDEEELAALARANEIQRQVSTSENRASGGMVTT